MEVKNNPLISVYITNYNYQDFIQTAINSVLEQTFQDFEIIIIDDGSTDNSRDIIEEYANHDKISIIYQQNKGLNVTNNIALRACSGKYIMRLDADDYLVHNALEIMKNKLEEDPTLGLVFPDYYYVDAEGGEIGRETRHDFENDVTLFDQAAHGACTMIRVDFLKRIGGYDESFNCQDGYELWIKFISHYRVSNINTPLFYYRQHGKNLTSNESRILSTRAKINAKFLSLRNVEVNALAVIPVRAGSNLPFEKIGDKCLLNIKIDQAIKASKVSKVVVISESNEVKEWVNTHINDPKVVFVPRTKEEARINVALGETLAKALESPEVAKDQYDHAVMVSLEYPFANGVKIDDAVNTLTVFGADSLISVRNDNSMLYQHQGEGMTPILDLDQATRFEREAIYRHVGGITVTSLKSFITSKNIIHGKVGHVVVDQLTMTGIKSKFDLNLTRLLIEQDFNNAKSYLNS